MASSARFPTNRTKPTLNSWDDLGGNISDRGAGTNPALKPNEKKRLKRSLGECDGAAADRRELVGGRNRSPSVGGRRWSSLVLTFESVGEGGSIMRTSSVGFILGGRCLVRIPVH